VKLPSSMTVLATTFGRWFDMGGSYGQDDVFVIWTMAIIWTLLLTAGLLEWFFERRKK